MKTFFRFATVLALLSSGVLQADIVTLDSDQSDYTFAGTNTYYITDNVYISGTSIFEGGAVIKYGGYGSLTVDTPDCQGNSNNPVIFTSRDDDRYGAVLPDSTGSPSGEYSLALGLVGSGDITIHDLQFNYASIALGYYGTESEFALWNVKVQDCNQAIDCESGGDFAITNLTIVDCPGGIVGHYMIGGNVMNSTFINVGGLVSDDEGYGEYGFIFRWCTFSNSSLGAFEVNIYGDHNGFADCGQFSDYTMGPGWVYGANYFGDDWYWLTNSAIGFWLRSTNHYLQQRYAPIQVRELYGTVFYVAALVNTNNFDTASWTDYMGTNLVVDLGSTNNGDYTVWIGLKGARDVAPVWQSIVMTIDTSPPLLVITNPVLSGSSATSGVPLLQIKGNANESLLSLTFDVSNAVSQITNQEGFVTDTFFDTNVFDFTTNHFQCFDIALTNGLNLVSIHATDMAGNTRTTNLWVTLDYSIRTNPPAISITWPQNGARLCGTNFTVDGTVDDPTATISAELVNGATNTFTGMVERNGRFWLDNLPLASGTNYLAITITDAAGNTAVTNFSVVQSSLTFTINVPSDDDLWHSKVTVTGTISDPDAAISVNGVTGQNNGDGTWTVTNVPTGDGGVACLSAKATPPGQPVVDKKISPDKPTGLFCIEDHYSEKMVDHLYEDTWNEDTPPLHTYHIQQTNVVEKQIDWVDGVGIGHQSQDFGEIFGQFDEFGQWYNETNDFTTVTNWTFTGCPDTRQKIAVDGGWDNVDPGSYHDSAWYVADSGRVRPRHGYTKYKFLNGGKEMVGRWVLHQIYAAMDHITDPNCDTPEDPRFQLHLPPEDIVLEGVGNLRVNATTVEEYGAWAGRIYKLAPGGTESDTAFKSPKDDDYKYAKISSAWTLRHYTLHTALADPNRERTKLGVGEEVTLTNMPAATHWSTTVGGVYPEVGGTTTFTAPSNAPPEGLKVTVTAQCTDAPPAKIEFTVFPPSGIDHARIDGKDTYPTNVVGAGMTNIVWVAPTSVSFYRVNILEIGEDATNMWGFFLQWTPQQLHHNPNDWISLNSNNNFTDHAAFGASGLTNWAAGGFEWNVPMRWQVTGAGVTNAMSGCDHIFLISSNGTATVLKYGNWVQRTTNNIITSN